MSRLTWDDKMLPSDALEGSILIYLRPLCWQFRLFYLLIQALTGFQNCRVMVSISMAGKSQGKLCGGIVAVGPNWGGNTLELILRIPPVCEAPAAGEEAG